MISLPLGKGQTRICLKDVLYAPKMGIMLISISKLDIAGYAALFHDKHCQIFDAWKKKLGEILLNKGLQSTHDGRNPRLTQSHCPCSHPSHAQGWHHLWTHAQ